jgi:DNA polymerase I-like protein with 3'-5' exonuclease and polymerase domains
MTNPIYFDTECCGLHGPVVLIQYTYGDGDIELYNPWHNPIQETIELINDFMYHEDGIIGFNLAFDVFHLCQMYTTLTLLPDKRRMLIDCIEEYALKEPKARFGACLKPQQSLDLMLHARKTEYQSTMDRKNIIVKRVPTPLAWELAKELDKRIPLRDIYFARKQDKTIRWQVDDILDEFGDMIPGFKNIVLRFAPSSALKALVADIFGIATEEIKIFANVEPPKKAAPIELGYAPFALAIGKPGNWKGAWPQKGKIDIHIDHWAYNRLAREYASDDVKYTRMLYKYFDSQTPGGLPMNDIDSQLACMVGAVRWRGFNINITKLKNLRAKKQLILDNREVNQDAPLKCREYLAAAMSETEKLVMIIDGKITTKANILEQVAKWKKEKVCGICLGEGCHRCEDGLIKTDDKHPAAIRATNILEARHASKAIQNIDKLLIAGRFHASFKVIGTLSSRMSGGDDLNPQGLERATEFRSCFPLADKEMILDGGDFAGFEVVLADAVYADPELRKDLLTGKKIHGLFGTFLFPGKSYDDILDTKGLPGERDIYTRSKNGVFAMLYGGESFTLQHRVGISEEAADDAYARWIKKYIVWGQARRKTFDMFCSMTQKGGIGTAVEWSEPSDYIESLYGFKRFFTLENKICKILFELAEKPPKLWKQLKIKIVRRERKQTVSGAVQSALFAAAFNIQSQNMRAASNHEIQSSGAQLTKKLQCQIWTIQPCGINSWRVVLLNVHDELMVPTLSKYSGAIQKIVDDFIIEERKLVPLLEIEWGNNLKDWSAK